MACADAKLLRRAHSGNREVAPLNDECARKAAQKSVIPVAKNGVREMRLAREVFNCKTGSGNRKRAGRQVAGKNDFYASAFKNDRADILAELLSARYKV